MRSDWDKQGNERRGEKSRAEEDVGSVPRAHVNVLCRSKIVLARGAIMVSPTHGQVAPVEERGGHAATPVECNRQGARRRLRLPALALAAALLVQVPHAASFALSPSSGLALRGSRLQVARNHAGRKTATMAISQNPETLVRLVGKSVVTQFREMGLMTSGFLRGGRIPAHESALRSAESLATWLQSHAGCDLSLWGVDKAKTPEQLLEELQLGESFLRPDGSRAVKVAKVRVFDGDYELVEVAQILGAKMEQDGGVTGGMHKDRKGRHLAEKFKPGETPLQACGRGISEELEAYVGSNPVLHVLNHDGRVVAWEETDTSTSYPGLLSMYQLYFLECEVEGLNRAATGSRFYTGEDCSIDGHCDKVHVWEWRPRQAATAVPEGCRALEATLWSA